jgi:pyruvate/2-oxoglutarate dehydrogenase complex dihydrolipoamide dehydrogenase (E3) component
VASGPLLRTSVAGIYACGDVTSLHQFTHMAGHQGGIASLNALFRPLARLRAEQALVPRATFTDPEVAGIGLTERAARDAGMACEVTRFDIGELDRAVTDSKRTGFVKVLTAPRRDRILGVTVVAADGAELLAPFSLAMRHGIGLRKLIRHIHPYPTLSEAGQRLAGSWQRARARPWQLDLLERFHRWRRGN